MEGKLLLLHEKRELLLCSLKCGCVFALNLDPSNDLHNIFLLLDEPSFLTLMYSMKFKFQSKRKITFFKNL